jgi:adenine-specific DNA methylase
MPITIVSWYQQITLTWIVISWLVAVIAVFVAGFHYVLQHFLSRKYTVTATLQNGDKIESQVIVEDDAVTFIDDLKETSVIGEHLDEIVSTEKLLNVLNQCQVVNAASGGSRKRFYNKVSNIMKEQTHYLEEISRKSTEYQISEENKDKVIADLVKHFEKLASRSNLESFRLRITSLIDTALLSRNNSRTFEDGLCLLNITGKHLFVLLFIIKVEKKDGFCVSDQIQ